MGLLADIFYFIVVIAVLVVVHELGHFLAARLTGMRSDIFSVGMGNRVFGYNTKTGFTMGKLPKDYEFDGETDYRLSAFPIGGYVKIVGMVDESMDTNYEASEPKPYEFRSKNALQKIFVLSAGVLMNFLLAIFIFAGIVFFNGESSYKTTTVGYVAEEGIGSVIGLEPGDRIISVNEQIVNSWNDIVSMLTIKDFAQDKAIRIIRNDERKIINVEGASLIKQIADKGHLGIDPYDVKTILLSVQPDEPAGKSGLQKNDTILSLNQIPVLSYTQFIDIVSNNPGSEVEISYKRDAFTHKTTVTPNEEGRIGVGITQVYTGEFTTENFNIIESFEKGITQTVATVDLFFRSIGQIFQGNLTFKQSVGGPIMIATKATEHAEQGLISFLSFMALLSISLAIINILPFPALDGGHLIFVIIEAVIRREVPYKIKMAIQQGGIVILLLFMLFVIFVDINRLF